MGCPMSQPFLGLSDMRHVTFLKPTWQHEVFLNSTGRHFQIKINNLVVRRLNAYVGKERIHCFPVVRLGRPSFKSKSQGFTLS